MVKEDCNKPERQISLGDFMPCCITSIMFFIVLVRITRKLSPWTYFLPFLIHCTNCKQIVQWIRSTNCKLQYVFKALFGALLTIALLSVQTSLSTTDNQTTIALGYLNNNKLVCKNRYFQITYEAVGEGLKVIRWLCGGNGANLYYYSS